MNAQNLIANYADYNLWANEQFLNWLSGKTDEQLNREVASSYSGILKTLNHIWGTESYWHAMVTRQTEFENRFMVQDLKREEVFEGLMKSSRQLATVVKSFTEAELMEPVKVVSPWFESNQTRAEYLQHLFNHATYHRGQIVTIGRNVGITDAPMTDYLFFNIAKEFAPVNN